MEPSGTRIHPTIKTPVKPIRLAPLERLMTRWFDQIERGLLTIEFPSGHQRTFSQGEVNPNAVLQIRDPKLILRMLFAGDLGLAELARDEQRRGTIVQRLVDVRASVA